MENRISPEEYAKAVVACIYLAQQSTGGGRVAAQVLLSAYNGSDFQLDVASLGNLDRNNYEHAITVIRGRYDTGREPHQVVKDGSTVFGELWKRWKRLELVERAKRECPDCEGRGALYLNPNDEEDMRTKPCSRCKGTGRICRCGNV
jgi:DnaJ-class molecular chaperone